MTVAARTVRATRPANDVPAHQDADAERAWIGFVFTGQLSVVKSVVRETGIRPDHLFSGSAAAAFSVACTSLAAGDEPTIPVVAAFSAPLGAWLRDEIAAWYAGPDSLRTGGVFARDTATLIVELAAKRTALRELDRARGMVEAGRPAADVAAHLHTLSEEIVRGVDAEPVSDNVTTAAQIWAPIPDVPFLVDGLLREGNLALLVAYGASLKTWQAIALQLSIATASRFLDRFDVCGSGSTLFVDWESGDHELRRRYQGCASAMGLSGPVEGVELLTMPSFHFTSPDFEARAMKLAEGRKLVIFDSLAAGSFGVDENTAQFAAPLQVLKKVAEKTGAICLVLHHAKKRGNGEGGPVDEREMVRGSGAIFAAADVVLALAREEGSDADAFVCKQVKARNGKRIEPFVLRVEDVAGGGVKVFATDFATPDADAHGDALERAKRAVLRLLSRERDLRSKSELARRVQGRKGTVLAAIAELEERSLIAVHAGAYRLTSEVSR
jgi:hypothetical protein